MKGERLKVKGILILLSIFNFQFSTCWADDDHIVDGLTSVAKIAGETKTVETVVTKRVVDLFLTNMSENDKHEEGGEK